MGVMLVEACRVGALFPFAYWLVGPCMKWADRARGALTSDRVTAGCAALLGGVVCLMVLDPDPGGWSATASMILVALLAVAAVVDMRSRLVSHQSVALMAGAALCICLFGPFDNGAWIVVQRIIEALLVSGALLVGGICFERITGRASFGGGDLKVVSAITLGFGLEFSLLALGASCLITPAWAALSGHGSVTKDSTVPLVACLCIGVCIALLVVGGFGWP